MSDPESATPADKGRGIIMAGSGVKLGLLGENPEFLFQRGAKAVHGVDGFNSDPNPRIRDRVVGQKSQKGPKKKRNRC